MSPTAALRLSTDIAVIGAGFAGSLMAMVLRRSGHRVALLERGRHPRFAIGESTTPLTNLLLEELADRYDLPAVRLLSKWGTWQATHGDLAVGLKRGFTFLFHEQNQPFADDNQRTRQMMVAASPHDSVADTHWYRPDLDHWLVREAQNLGVDYLDDAVLDTALEADDAITLQGRQADRPLTVSAAFVVDASGARGFLSRVLSSGPSAPDLLPPTQGLYTHFADVQRWDAVCPPAGTPPYPPDDAALHHVFAGGWIWVLRFNNGVTSAGVAMTDDVAAPLRPGADAAGAWRRLLDQLPSVRDQFEGSRAILPFVHAPRLAFRCSTVAGRRWALLPSAAGFIDPLLSSGFPLTLLGIGRLADVLNTPRSGGEQAVRLAAYARDTLDELDVTERLVAALYASMAAPELFTRLSLLYFAAASFSETVRRLDRPHLAPGFLMHRHPTFGPELRACADLARALPPAFERAALFDRIDRAIEPFDAAGLLDRSRLNWYPVLADDLRAGASKLDATVDEVNRLLARCGLAG